MPSGTEYLDNRREDDDAVASSSVAGLGRHGACDTPAVRDEGLDSGELDAARNDAMDKLGDVVSAKQVDAPEREGHADTIEASVQASEQEEQEDQDGHEETQQEEPEEEAEETKQEEPEEDAEETKHEGSEEEAEKTGTDEETKHKTSKAKQIAED